MFRSCCGAAAPAQSLPNCWWLLAAVVAVALQLLATAAVAAVLVALCIHQPLNSLPEPPTP
jgi:hypothetical protein